MTENGSPHALVSQAIELLRDRAKAALDFPDERWMVDQSEDSGLVVGCFVPEDVDDDGVVSTGCIAYFAYPDDEQRRAHAFALPIATHMANLDPATALAMADVLEAALPYLSTSRWQEYPVAVKAAAMAATYLRVEQP